MSLRASETDFHQSQNLPPVTATGSLRVLPALAKRLNRYPDWASAIPQHPADAAFPDRIYCLGWVTAWAAVVVLVVFVVSNRPVYQNSAAADFSAAPLADFVGSVVAGCSSPAADPGFASDCFAIVDSAVAGFAADCFVIVVVAVAAAAAVAVAVVVVVVVAADLSALGPCLSSDLFCSADFVAAVVAAVWDASSVAQSLP